MKLSHVKQCPSYILKKAIVVPGIFTVHLGHQEENLFSIAVQMLKGVVFIYNNA